MNVDASNEPKTGEQTASSDCVGGIDLRLAHSEGNPLDHVPAITYAGILFIGVFTLYAHVLSFAFLNYDDTLFVTHNAHVLQGFTWKGVKWAFTNINGYYIPITWVFHMLEVQCFGLKAGYFHAVNVLLHAGNSCLLFCLLNRFTSERWKAFVVAWLFSLHPLNVESAAWVSELKGLLCALFGLVCVYFYGLFVITHKNRTYLLSLLFYLASLMSKPVLVGLPFALCILDLWPFGVFRSGAQMSAHSRKLKWSYVRSSPTLFFKSFKGKVAFLVISLSFCYLTMNGQHNAGAAPHENVSIAHRLNRACINICRYLPKCAVPLHLSAFYPMDGHFEQHVALGSITVLLVVSVASLWWLGKYPCFCAMWCWFLMALFPCSNFIQNGSHSIADRNCYLPIIGFLIFVVWTQDKILDVFRIPRAVGIATCLLLGGLWCGLTIKQIPHWQNSISLFQDTVKKEPASFIAHYNLGAALNAEGRSAEAFGEFNEALRIEDRFPEAHNDLGAILYKQGEFSNAVVEFRRALRLKPHLDMAQNNLALAYIKHPEYQESLNALEEVRHSEPNQTRLLILLANIYAFHPDPHVRNIQEALRLARRADLLTASNDLSAVRTLANAYEEAGFIEKAQHTRVRAFQLAKSAGLIDVCEAIEREMQSPENVYPIITP